MLTVTVTGVEELRAALSAAPKRAEWALRTAINGTASHAQTESVRRIGQEWNAKQKDIRKALTVTKATAARLEASVQATGGRGKRIPLVVFGARQTRKGVTVKVKRAGGRGLLPGAFIATMKSGHRGVFVRAAKSRKQGTPYRALPIRTVKTGAWAGTTYRPGLPIVEKASISIASMWNRGIIDQVVTESQSFMTRRVNALLQLELTKLGLAGPP